MRILIIGPQGPCGKTTIANYLSKLNGDCEVFEISDLTTHKGLWRTRNKYEQAEKLDDAIFVHSGPLNFRLIVDRPCDRTIEIRETEV